MKNPKYLYKYKILKGIHKDEEIFLTFRKGSEFVKKGYAVFLYKIEKNKN
jgi:hypothetical protein